MQGSKQIHGSKQLKELLWVALGFALLAGLGFWLSPRGMNQLLDALGVGTRDFLMVPLFNLGKVPVSLLFLIKTFVFLIILSVVSTRLRILIYSKILANSALRVQDRYILARFCSIAIFGIGLMIGLESAGLNLNTLAILGGTLGIGVGFGLQSNVANWVAGILLLIEQPVRIGDRIDIKNTTGVIIRIGGRSTWVRTYNNEVVIVPNSDLTTQQVTNWTGNDPKVRLAIPIGVGYGSDPKEIRRVLTEIAMSHPEVLAEPSPEVIFMGFGASSLDFMLRFWTLVRDRDNYGIKSDLYFAIFDAFHQRRIEMPFAQRDLHLKSVDVPIVVKTVSAPMAETLGSV
jgi:small-conductance mechanosensitive channel